MENPHINVAIGGGQHLFLPEGEPLPCCPGEKGTRLDGLYLAEKWLKKQESLGRKAKAVMSNEDFNKTDFAQLDSALGN